MITPSILKEGHVFPIHNGVIRSVCKLSIRGGHIKMIEVFEKVVGNHLANFLNATHEFYLN